MCKFKVWGGMGEGIRNLEVRIDNYIGSEGKLEILYKRVRV